MNQSRYNISLYVIIPVIFGGLSILSSLVVTGAIQYYMRHGQDFTAPVVKITLVFGVVGYVLGLVLVWIILKPVEKFVADARQTPVMNFGQDGDDEKPTGDQIEQFTQLFNQVTHTLSRVDARQLFPRIIGESSSMRGVMSQIIKVAPTESTVLILGESGTGKELVASSICEHSMRYQKPYVTINCVAIPENLLESELFGYEKGAFTGANARKIGKFEQADGGTIFLDEIGDMPLAIQGKMLRVLQEREIDRLGGTGPIPVDVRIIAATNKDIGKMVQEGTFRQDLYYRLNVFTIRIPPLKDRREDIPLLVQSFLEKAAGSIRLTPTAVQSLADYGWPGNIRELQNVIESAAVMAEQGIIRADQLPSTITKGIPDTEKEQKGETISLDEQMQQMEKRIIVEALRKTGGVQVRAAELLGINQRSLWHRVKKYEIDVAAIKNQQEM
jgi:transcriptional regulator with PAS, ATPase and Fis domain